jgi:hypothetical protein
MSESISNSITIEINEVLPIDSSDTPLETPPLENPTLENPTLETPSVDQVTIQIIETPPVENPPLENPTLETPSVDQVTIQIIETPPVENPPLENPPLENPTLETRPLYNQVTIEIIESPPNPIVELMKQHSNFALLIGLNYVDFPEVTLKNRIKGIDNAKQKLINVYGFTEENIMVLIEPCREKVLSTLNTIIGSSNLISELMIYYSGYGNGIIKTDVGFYAETGVIDNLAKQIIPADFAEIGQDEFTSMLNNSCCKTVCIMDMCPYGNEEMLLKWSADVNNLVKVITLCESDSHNTNKYQLRELHSLMNPPSF